jgi:hypothetical protein
VTTLKANSFFTTGTSEASIKINIATHTSFCRPFSNQNKSDITTMVQRHAVAAAGMKTIAKLCPHNPERETRPSANAIETAPIDAKKNVADRVAEKKMKKK